MKWLDVLVCGYEVVRLASGAVDSCSQIFVEIGFGAGSALGLWAIAW